MSRFVLLSSAMVFGLAASSATIPASSGNERTEVTQGHGASLASENPMTGQAPGAGAPDIPTSDHDVFRDLMPSWDCANGACGQPAPRSPLYDPLGAFRFVCRHTNLARDDPTVFPGQPGKSHLHDQTGVFGWNAYSTYRRLRTGGGGSGCNDVAGQDHNLQERDWAANRTPYWQPALLDGKGNVILADFTSFYYKRRPASDPIVSDPSNPKYQGRAVPLPNGLKFIFGARSDNPALPAPRGESPVFMCELSSGANVSPKTQLTFAQAIECAKQPGHSFSVHMSAPDCWDGIHLDAPDHRSHMGYVSYGNWGFAKCDAQHPYVVPTFTYAAVYTILPTDDGDIHFSSDEMDNSKPRGWSFHVDYGPAAWDPVVLKMWTDGCINQKLNCSGGDLGNGRQLKGAAQPIYHLNGSWIRSWQNPKRLVAVGSPM